MMTHSSLLAKMDRNRLKIIIETKINKRLRNKKGGRQFYNIYSYIIPEFNFFNYINVEVNFLEVRSEPGERNKGHSANSLCDPD